MTNLHRFLYGTFFSSMIAWTIYLLTVDFYSLAVVSQHYKHLVSIPFPGDWLNLYSLALINLVTLFVIFVSAIIAKIVTAGLSLTSWFRLKRSEEEVKA
ncbi:hypothetical protein [Commensalibacter oyaizuii]|uniref:Uncharacterized protein n=1 Tax=Commensalibacter oyaizuii TaxID=3043873 RepID=A0ABT6Q3Q5_9PROT|nr:hypothetical protein [Commensalibacter sp. TBRC 16381]MDI2091762.1 hypothetical protein [Commensalibacter sp. TBRC 16381]